MNTTVIIPARYGSTRFPGKPLADLFGRPVIYWVCRQVRKCRYVDSFMVATDDKRIYSACRDYGLPVRMTSADHGNGTERVAEVVSGLPDGLFVNVQGDEPMIAPETVDAVIEAFHADADLEYAQAAKRIEVDTDYDDDTVVKIVVDAQGYALYLSRSRIPYPRNLEGYRAYKHIGVYGFRKQFLLDMVKIPRSYLESIEGIEQLRAVENGRKLRVVEVQSDTISVDVPRDLQRIIAENKSFFVGNAGQI